jgi:hypothetical protein
MAKRKQRSERTRTGSKKGAVKRAPGRRAQARRGKKAAAKKTVGKRASGKKRPGKKTKRAPVSGRSQGRAGSSVDAPLEDRGLGPEAGGQSGDTEGLSRVELADSESVEELLEEGQAFEAGIVSGVENAPDADKGGVRTRQVPEDDVPQEYLDED